LKDLAANVKKMFEIPCALSAKGTIPALPHHTTMQLYKIAQEAISNAVKHGKATQVSIALIRGGDTLTLSIKNDGTPFAQPAHPTKRMGLRIMNYRASLIGASLEIEANKVGTTVTCAVPVKIPRSQRASTRSGESEEIEPETVGSGDQSR
jgi:signal transduction histidine kinase